MEEFMIDFVWKIVTQGIHLIVPLFTIRLVLDYARILLFKD